MISLEVVVALLVISWPCARALWQLVWRPYEVARSFGRQAIHGPPYRFAVGSLSECRQMLIAGKSNSLDPRCHNYSSLVHPFFEKWVHVYGKTFLYWLGPKPSICSIDMELVKQVLADRTNLFQKDYLNPRLEVILGKGLILLNGDDWKRHRKVLHPVFNQENLKAMAATAAESTEQMMDRWCVEIKKGNGQQVETDLKREFHEVSLAVSARVVFGRDCKDAMVIADALTKVQALTMSGFHDLSVPGFRYLPTRRNLRSSQLEALVTSKMMHLIKTRLAGKEAGGSYGDDVLGLALQAKTLSTDEIIGQCKTIFAAGLDTSATLLTWAMFLLSTNLEWQDNVREEVLRECGGGVPSVDALAKLKLLHMVILETLRLYSPVPYMLRKAASDTVLADIIVPKGTTITIPVAMLHRDKEVWGADADQFNPMRFQNGISNAANHPNALLSFSYGPRVCAGQNFAMIEVQTVMAMMLTRFSFCLSPNYIHKPTTYITLAPRYGLPVIVRNISDGHARAILA